MGAVRQFRAARVYQKAMKNVAIPPPAHLCEIPPPWLPVIESIPPAEILTRSVPVRHQPPNRRLLKPRHTFRPEQITYEEDELRQTFFQDHPWELARPRVVVETDGKDARRYDWSKGLIQPGLPLGGECVVQRQLWMMHNIPGITKEQAYDRARREFYWLRQQEEIERRIAQEEARMVGAYFGKTRLQIGMELEDHQFDRWKGWAAAEMRRLDAARNQATESFADQDAASAPGEAAATEGALEETELKKPE